jgi:hypothetical protein
LVQISEEPAADDTEAKQTTIIGGTIDPADDEVADAEKGGKKGFDAN